MNKDKKQQYFRDWFSARKRWFFIILLWNVLQFLLVWLYRIPLSGYAYFWGLGWIGTLVFVTWDFIRYRKHIRYVQKQSVIFPFQFQVAHSIIEAHYQCLLYECEKQINELDNERKEELAKANDYYALWTHQIKTPISALKLILQKEKPTHEIATMENELFKMERYVDMVLQYQRLQQVEKPFDFAEYSLESLVRQAVKNYAPWFIYRQTSIDIELNQEKIITDKTWFVFVLEQIISNALKYSPKEAIRIFCDDENLIIQDDGMGISPEYLPHIFERGALGNAGHNQRYSTGVGLYLSRNILQSLSLSIRIESAVGIGTKVYITRAIKTFDSD